MTKEQAVSLDNFPHSKKEKKPIIFNKKKFYYDKVLYWCNKADSDSL